MRSIVGSGLVALGFLATPLHAQPAAPTVLWARSAGAASVAFSPDGRYVASGGLQSRNPFSFGRVDVWSSSDGTSLGHAEAHGASGLIGYTGDVAFSPDGATLATANGTTYCAAWGGCSPDRPGLFTWSVPELQPGLGRTDLSPASAVAWSPDGSTLAASFFDDHDGADRTHAAGSLDVLQVLPGHANAANDVAWSPDGTLLASVGDDGYVRLWDVATGVELRSLFHGDYASGGTPISVAFSPDGALVASSGDGYGLRVKLWRVSDGSLVHDLDGSLVPSSYGSVVVTFTPSGRHLVAGLQQYVSGDDWRGRVRFWDVGTGSVALEYAETGPAPSFGGVTSLAFSPAKEHLFAYTVAGQVKVAETPLALADPVAGVPPHAGRFRLEAPRPNPFSDRVEFLVEVPTDQHVRAELFDPLGRRVARVFEGLVRSGAPQRLALEAGGVAAGRYVVRVEGERFVASRAVTLVR